jgi:uracil-DNA glycosylase family 4
MIKTLGNPNAPIVVVVEAPNEDVYNSDRAVMRKEAMLIFMEVCGLSGLHPADLYLITPCPPIPNNCIGSDSRTYKYLDQVSEMFWEEFSKTSPKCIVTMGKVATRQVFKRPVKITEIQGVLQDVDHLPCKVLPVLSPGNVVSRPETRPKFESDMRTLGQLLANGWRFDDLKKVIESSVYEWTTDLSHLIDNPPKGVCVDTETAAQVGHASSGLDNYERRPETTFKPESEGGGLCLTPRGFAVPLIAQLSYRKQHSYIIPLDRDYCPQYTEEEIKRGKEHLKIILEDARIQKTGHNFNFDFRIFNNQGIWVEGWTADTLLLTFTLDENMQKKSLDEGVARWLPEYAGYSKEFESKVDYNRMRDVPHDLMTPYAGGDTDVGLQLARIQLTELMKDERQWNCFKRIQMPALRAFTRISIEGWRIDKDSLREMYNEIAADEEEIHRKLLELVPRGIMQQKLEQRKKGQSDKELFNFKSPDLIRDILFTPQGYGLEPVMWTESTMNLEDEEDRLASTSTKKHLPYFDKCPFVKVLEDYVKTRHMMDSFVGYEQHIIRRPARKGARTIGSKSKRVIEVDGVKYVEEIVPEKGIWKNMDFNGRVHPRFHVDRVVTGRTSCSEPNIQQVPKRGKWAKRYRKVYLPDTEDGWIVAADLSQIELRLVAWMAQETTMLEIYRTGGDIHAATGASVSGITMADFYAMEESAPDEFEFKRYLAKAVNFGFVYGAWWTTFQEYAKTQFGIDVSDKDAKLFRERFFEQFYDLEPWHKGMKKFAKDNGYVRAMHGAIRRLPAIYSPEKFIVQEAERQSVNSPIQRMGSDLGLIGLTRFDRDAPRDRMRVKGFVHDQIIVAVDREEDVQVAAQSLKFYMQNLPLRQWFGIEAPLPILADVEVGRNMGDLKKRKDIQPIPPDWYRADLDAK